MASTAQKMARSQSRRENRGWNYIETVRPAVAQLTAGSTTKEIDSALAALEQWSSAGKGARKGMRAAARKILGIADPSPDRAIVRSKNGSYGFEMGGGTAALTRGECVARGLAAGPLNL